MEAEKKQIETKVFYSGTENPWFNLAIENWIFNDIAPEKHYLYLWRNSDTVVIGRYQNPWKECRLEIMEKDNVKLARRQSGGGAVYHDRKNLNFTFMSGVDNYSKERNFEIIIQALSKLGIKAEVSGRNDILVEGRKISGSAFKLTKDRAFHHGTLLVDVDLERLSMYLNPDRKKLESKGIKSVKSRVANLNEYNNEIDTEVLERVITETFFEYRGSGEKEILDLNVLKRTPRLIDYYELMKSWEWVYKKSPDFNYRLEKWFEWGTVEINLDVKNAEVLDAVIFTDCLYPEMINKFVKKIKGVPFERSSIEAVVESVCDSNSDWVPCMSDILTAVVNDNFN